MYQFDDFIACGRIRAKMDQYRRKRDKAMQLCADALESHKSPYVALSGGKDSVAMSFIVNEAAEMVGKDFTLWVHLSDASFPGTRETCEEVARRTGHKLDISEYPGSAFDLLKKDKAMAFGKQGVFFSEVRKYAETKDLAFVGTRAKESKRRMQAANIHGDSFYSRSMGNVDVVCPLQWFDLQDVAAALVEYDAPIHPIYRKTPIDTGDNANGDPYFIRLSYITSRDLWEKGTLVFLKLNYPDLYNKVISASEEASIYG